MVPRYASRVQTDVVDILGMQPQAVPTRVSDASGIRPPNSSDDKQVGSHCGLLPRCGRRPCYSRSYYHVHFWSD